MTRKGKQGMTKDRINLTTEVLVANKGGVQLVEICRDDEAAMVCAGQMRISSFADRAAFIASDWVPAEPGGLIATELETFDIWVDDPQFREAPPLRVISEWIPAVADRV